MLDWLTGRGKTDSAGLGVALDGATASVEAEVVPAEAKPKTVTMYLEGVGVEVPVEAIATFQARGFQLHGAADLPGQASELIAVAENFGPAVRRLVEHIQEHRSIDPSADAELHTVTKVWNAMDKGLHDLLQTAYANYPMREVD